MKHRKKLFLFLLLAALVIGIFPVAAHAEARSYQIRIYAGNKGTIAGGTVFVDTKPYSKTDNYALPEITATDGYYVKGIKESGKDTSTLEDLANQKYLELLYSNPAGFQLTARMTTNYQELRTIYFSRRTNRLPEWRAFCQWIETLPHAEFITHGK